MAFSIAQLIAAQQAEQYPLHLQCINPPLARLVGAANSEKHFAMRCGVEIGGGPGTAHKGLGEGIGQTAEKWGMS